MARGQPNWTYNTTFSPRTGNAIVAYTVHESSGENNVTFNIYVDPAGYIYDIGTGKRIAGASVWLQQPNGKAWENVPTGVSPSIAIPDVNPLVADTNGMYQWIVLLGSYRVHVKAPRYEPANSTEVNVPPQVTNLYVGLVLSTVQNPALTITKTPNPSTYTDEASVTYTYLITNTGNVTLSNIGITDNLPGIILGSLNTTTLGPGQQATGTGTYTTTQSDYDNGYVINTATVYNVTTPLNQTQATITAINQNPALNITKVASPSSYDHIGKLITYTYTVSNTGNMDIAEPITVYDNKISAGQITIGTSGSVLAVGQNVTGTATYTVIQADLDIGSVTNSAYATGPNNIVISNNTSVTVLAIQKPNLKLDKDVDPKTYFTVGDLLDYSYTLTNKGNVDIAGPITVTDSMFGSSEISFSGLAPGQSVTRGKSYLITPQDIENGFVINSAFATGSFNDKTVTSNSDKAIIKFFGPTTNLFSS